MIDQCKFSWLWTSVEINKAWRTDCWLGGSFCCWAGAVCVQMTMIRTSIKQREGERESPEIRLGKFLGGPGKIRGWWNMRKNINHGPYSQNGPYPVKPDTFQANLMNMIHTQLYPQNFCFVAFRVSPHCKTCSWKATWKQTKNINYSFPRSCS